MTAIRLAPDTSIAAFSVLQAEYRNDQARHANEVRRLAALRSHDERAEYLRLAGKHRSAELIENLRRDVWTLMRGEGRKTEPEQEGLFA